MAENWAVISKQVQESVLNSIPAPWKLPPQFQVAPGANISTVIPDNGLLTPEQLDITSKDCFQLAADVREGRLTAYKVTEAFCARAALAHQLANCLISFFPEEALERASELDRIYKETNKIVGPLHGVPVSIKDTYHVKGKPSTLGYVALWDNIAEDDAVIVQLLRKAGAVIFCKTTMPQTGMALETKSNLFGTTLNPFNVDFGAGGSSGGDASLIAMRGAPVAPMTDIGGSIRAPAAFNGLYAIRPTADRIPKTGFQSWNPGQMSIRVSAGPGSHSVRDLKIVTKVLNAHPDAQFDISCTPVPWRELAPAPETRYTFGVLAFDGVVMPHPPIRRALQNSVEQLRAAGHEVIEFKLPFSAWEIAKSTFKLYFQTGAAEAKAYIKETQEPTIPVFQHYLDVFDIGEVRAAEIFALNRELAANKLLFRETWEETKSPTSGKPIDAIICPAAPSQGIPHDFPIWWGYTSLWNYLDYPSTILPCKNIRLDASLDIKDVGYSPVQGVADFDRLNFELYEPSRFQELPTSIQIVGRPFQDEELLEVTEMVDKAINPSG